MSQAPVAGSSSKFSAMAIVAFVLAILVPLVGLILGIIAALRISRTGMRGRGLALAAIIVGAILLILEIIGFSTGHLFFFATTTTK